MVSMIKQCRKEFSMDKTSRDYMICLCFKTTRGEVEDYIRSHEVADLKDLC